MQTTGRVQDLGFRPPEKKTLSRVRRSGIWEFPKIGDPNVVP